MSMGVRIPFLFAFFILSATSAKSQIVGPNEPRNDDDLSDLDLSKVSANGQPPIEAIDEPTEDEADKRGKWQGNSMAMWGKRRSIKKWNRKKWTGRQMAMWGKRSSGRAASELPKKWSGKEMPMWGKRNSGYDDVARKRWSGKEMPMWGKRNLYSTDVDAKRWSGKDMAMWGKRRSTGGENRWEGMEDTLSENGNVNENYLDSAGSKRWTGKDMAMWGKRGRSNLTDNEIQVGDNKLTNDENLNLGRASGDDLTNNMPFRDEKSIQVFLSRLAKELSSKMKNDFLNSNSIDNKDVL